MPIEKITIETSDIRLDGALKYSGLVGTGGEAKYLIQSGYVRVNGAVEIRRASRLCPGDRVELCDEDGSPRVILEIHGGTT